MPTYAVIETGSKQYRVKEGDVIDVDHLADAAPGDTVSLDKVVLVGGDDEVAVGTPYVQGATVTAKVVGEPKGDKVAVFRYKPKVRYRKTTGHRTQFSRIQIEKIQG